MGFQESGIDVLHSFFRLQQSAAACHKVRYHADYYFGRQLRSLSRLRKLASEDVEHRHMTERKG